MTAATPPPPRDGEVCRVVRLDLNPPDRRDWCATHGRPYWDHCWSAQQAAREALAAAPSEPVEPPAEGEIDWSQHVGSCRIFYAERRCTCIGTEPPAAYANGQLVVSWGPELPVTELPPAETQQDDELPECNSICYAMCGKNREGCPAVAALAARPSADTETLRQAWDDGYAAGWRDTEMQPYSDAPERATWKPTPNPYRAALDGDR